MKKISCSLIALLTTTGAFQLPTTHTHRYYRFTN